MEVGAATKTGHGQASSSALQRLLRLKVQGRDGNFHELVMVHHGDSNLYNNLQECNTTLVHQAHPAICPLRLVAPASNSPTSVQSSNSVPRLLEPAESFFLRSDAFNLVLTWLAPDDWMQLEGTCRRSRAAVASSGCWLSPRVMAGHSLRFQPEDRKAAYVRHRRAVARVAKAFEDLRRFARSPDSVFNPGATLAEAYNAEQRTGVVFPDEARASFILFDGQARSAWLRSEGVIGGFELLSLEQSVELMLEEACFRGPPGQVEFVPLADRRGTNVWLVAAVDDGKVCVIKQLSRPKVVARSWSAYLRVQ